ncbi:MAG: GNAT family N-acetyltransferase [Candidatus Omnitrophica bacterium]|nr:GNAT family N-acetyltransferase [Candidatus Omnitrophota bacterium]
MEKVKVEMRLMRKEDIPFGMKLKNIAGWNQLEADWKRFLSLEPKGCFVAMAEDRKIGTVTTICYGAKFSWVGMVLVPPEERRKGIGTALLRYGISYGQRKGVESVRLDATPLGKKLYNTLGFKDEYRLERREGKGRSLEVAGGVSVMKQESLGKLIAFDESSFGADRGEVLRRLFEEYPDNCFLWEEGKDITGYLMCRPGYNAYQIGPWIVEKEEVAEELFKAALNKLSGEKIFFDVPLVNENAVRIADKYGFQLQRPFIRMYLGENRYPGRPEKIYAISGVEKG